MGDSRAACENSEAAGLEGSLRLDILSIPVHTTVRDVQLATTRLIHDCSDLILQSILTLLFSSSIASGRTVPHSQRTIRQE